VGRKLAAQACRKIDRGFLVVCLPGDVLRSGPDILNDGELHGASPHDFKGPAKIAKRYLQAIVTCEARGGAGDRSIDFGVASPPLPEHGLKKPSRKVLGEAATTPTPGGA
jgi:hypothetical protein